MKTEKEIAKKNVEEWGYYSKHKDRFARILEEHKATCQRWLGFLEEKPSRDLEDIGKIRDLKQAIKIYDENGI